jgi:putative adenylate-forming enzyme
MNLRLIVDVLRMRRQHRRREHWTRSEVDAFHRRALRELRSFAVERSAFYRRIHRGLESKSLEHLPVVTKGDLMGAFDEFVTDPSVRLRDVEGYLAGQHGDELFHDRYWIARTSGTTGHPGIFLANRREWTTIIASYARAQEWAGIHADLLRRTRLGVVSSLTPWHQSAIVGRSVDSPFVPVRRWDATQPIMKIVAGLNDWQPENLIAYASMARVLADEQIAGNLRIRPKAVMCASEVLTTETRARIEQAWGVAPFNVYAATEPAGLASECSRHRLHLFEDLVITEVVDDQNRPVPKGRTGAKILVTVLFSRTQPLIRYEMSDSVSLSVEPCDCGLPFATLGTIEGRVEDTLTLPGVAGGTVRVHPNVFHGVLERVPVREWQVIQEAGAIRVLLARPAPGVEDTLVAAELRKELRTVGAAALNIVVERVDQVPRTAAGKAPLVRARRDTFDSNRQSTPQEARS